MLKQPARGFGNEDQADTDDDWDNVNQAEGYEVSTSAFPFGRKIIDDGADELQSC